MWNDKEIMNLLLTVAAVVVGCFILGYWVLP